GKAAPGRFFCQRTSNQQDHNECWEVTEQQERRGFTCGRDRSRREQKAEEKQRRETNEDKEIPAQADTPEHTAVQQAVYACTPLAECCHDECGQGWCTNETRNDHPERLRNTARWLVKDQEEKHINRPAPAKGHEVKKDQWVLAHFLHKAIGRRQ